MFNWMQPEDVLYLVADWYCQKKKKKVQQLCDWGRIASEEPGNVIIKNNRVVGFIW